MKNKKIILIIVVLLIIIGASYFVINSFNSHDDLNVINNTVNNTINNRSLDLKNFSNTSNDTLEDDDISYESSFDCYSNSKSYSSSKSESNSDGGFSDEFTASDARFVVKDYVGGVDDYDISDLKIGKPKYKNSDGGWLVPLYDKKTDKFVDSVYAYDNGMASGGVHDYDNYKKIISGKKPKKSENHFVNLRN